MKRTLSLVLAALLLASSVVSCGKTEPAETKITETKAPETKAPETKSPATEAPETAAPAPEYAYDTSLITENGIAKSHIVLLDGYSEDEKTAADELAYHIKLVSGGAEVAITNTVQSDSLPIIIATPATLPELETLFPEDLAWLRTVKEDNGKGDFKRWTPNGFAIREHEGKIYIFGATGIGALNGVYDFIEETMDVIWIGSTDESIIYDKMATITTTKRDYTAGHREKSPFFVGKIGSNGVMFRRNKKYDKVSLAGAEHNAKTLVMTSPIYDPNITEYWETDINGKPLEAGYTRGPGACPPGESRQINFWSTLTADTVAASIIAQLDSCGPDNLPDYYHLGMEDEPSPRVYPEVKEPFEYAPGQFVSPKDPDYLSTVYFSFYNRVAKQVAEKYPTVSLNVLTYTWSVNPPRCELEKNISIWLCPYNDDYTIDSYELALELEKEGYPSYASEFAHLFQSWNEKFPETDVIIYNYYFCYGTLGLYERPIWYKLQNDLQDYAEWGYVGTTTCATAQEGNYAIYTLPGMTCPFTYHDGILMNRLSYWLYVKLLWNPYENVDELIVEFCDKVYGEASEAMQDYYRLLREGWKIGAELIPLDFNSMILWNRDKPYYDLYFLDVETDDGVHILDGLKEALNRAWEAADDKAKEFIRYPYEVFLNW